MIKATVAELRPDDEFKAGQSGRTYRVKSTSTDHNDLTLTRVYCRNYDQPMLITTEETVVLVTKMVREFQVPCVSWSHGDDPVTVLHDLARGPAPRALICGNCNDAADAAVVTEKLRQA